MTEDSAPAASKTAKYVQTWAESFSQVLGQIAGAPLPCSMESESPADLPASGESDLWATVTSTGSLRGEMTLRMPPATGLRLAQIFMSEPAAPEAELTADDREAVVELLRQIAGIVSTAARSGWGEMQLRVEAGAPPSWPAAENFWLLSPLEGLPSLVLEVGLSAALAAELTAEKVEPGKVAENSSARDRPPAGPDSAVPPETGALQLLMDVQLALTMRFGAKRLLLREVLDLVPGSVVELDRRVQEPVDLLLEGRLVARGEVVVIDGSYGLRVTDISPFALDQPVERVR